MYEEYIGYKFSQGEILPEEFLVYEYLQLNQTLDEISQKYKIAKTRIKQSLKHHAIRKPNNLLQECIKRINIEKYGVSNYTKTAEYKNKVHNSNLREIEQTLNINKEILEELYIKQNKSQKELQEYFHCSSSIIQKLVTEYKLYKPIKLAQEVKRRNNLNKYGVEHPSQIDEIKQKISKGWDNIKENPDKLQQIITNRKQTNIDRYGYDSPFKVPQFIEKGNITKLEKYGTTNINALPEKIQKTKDTVFNKYGVNSVGCLPEVCAKKKRTLESHFTKQQLIQKTQNTCMNRYGAKTFAQSKYCNWDDIQQKRYNTMKKNKSFNMSKPEKQILSILEQKFVDIKTNYKSVLYPFKCDFYIPQLDLYIEYQGHISHGKHAFNENDEQDRTLLKLWEQRSEECNFKHKKKDAYKGYITTWTIRDPKKRQTAKDNNLNWIEFFTMDEFMEWFNSLN